MSDEQCLDVLLGITNIMLPLTLGAAYTSRFFVPTYGKGMVVDAEDIFAVCYTSDYRLTANSSEVILCAVFTNDPYIPVFPMVFLGKTGMFELLKSKKGRENVKATFESNCPKLTYPVMELKEMKKIVKKEESVRGNIDKKFMLKNMEDAHYSSGLFDTRGLSERLGEYTEALMEEYGYYPVTVINEEIGMGDKKIAKFWKDKMAKFTQK